MTNGKLDISDIRGKITNAHIAHAMIATQSCHNLLRRIYESDRSRYSIAAEQSAHKGIVAPARCRPDYPFIGLCALGVLEVCDDYMKLQALFRACDAKAFDRMIALGPPVRLERIFRIHMSSISKTMCNRILLILCAANALEYEIDISGDASQHALRSLLDVIMPDG